MVLTPRAWWVSPDQCCLPLLCWHSYGQSPSSWFLCRYLWSRNTEGLKWVQPLSPAGTGNPSPPKGRHPERQQTQLTTGALFIATALSCSHPSAFSHHSKAQSYTYRGAFHLWQTNSKPLWEWGVKVKVCLVFKFFVSKMWSMPSPFNPTPLNQKLLLTPAHSDAHRQKTFCRRLHQSFPFPPPPSKSNRWM